MANFPARFRQGFMRFYAFLCIYLHFGRFAQSIEGQ